MSCILRVMYNFTDITNGKDAKLLQNFPTKLLWAW